MGLKCTFLDQMRYKIKPLIKCCAKLNIEMVQNRNKIVGEVYKSLGCTGPRSWVDLSLPHFFYKIDF